LRQRSAGKGRRHDHCLRVDGGDAAATDPNTAAITPLHADLVIDPAQMNEG
jgi:hypothetical protein